MMEYLIYIAVQIPIDTSIPRRHLLCMKINKLTLKKIVLHCRESAVTATRNKLNYDARVRSVIILCNLFMFSTFLNVIPD